MSAAPGQLKRDAGLFGALLLGLGAILGTGVFVSLGLGAFEAGGAVLVAIVLAAFVALLNGLSSAQLASAHPVAGGTYVYGYRFVHPLVGYTAGWLFLCAKSASASAAALAFAAYLRPWVGLPEVADRWVALGTVGVLTGLILAGLRRTNWLNLLLVGITVGALMTFFAEGVTLAVDRFEYGIWPGLAELQRDPGAAVPGVLTATALIFVAYTGYGRVATMGEEITNPKRNIPIAIVLTIGASCVLYLMVAFAAMGVTDASTFAHLTLTERPVLEDIARKTAPSYLPALMAVGAGTALLGVLLNLVLGLSRVWLAMGRQGDLPQKLGRLSQGQQPVAAIVLAGGVVGSIALSGDLRLAWSFSAFTVLGYYGLTNLCALFLPRESRRFPRFLAVLGLLACVSLAFFVDAGVLAVGVGVIVVGWVLLAVRHFAGLRTASDQNP